jgi:hypothetical protein
VESLALPLRIGKDGRLARTDAVTALLSVIRAMAASPASSWAHAPWFGLQEVFEKANTEREDQHDIQDALNRGLAGLGVTWASVGPVRLVRGEAPGVRRFELTLLLSGGQAVHRTLNA